MAQSRDATLGFDKSSANAALMAFSRSRALRPVDLLKLESLPRAHSSVGRAPARQAGGHWFEPSCAHLVMGTER